MLFRYVKEDEKKVYDDIIFRKKEKILKNQNPTIKEIFGNSNLTVIKLLSEHFKNVNYEINKNHYEYLDTIKLLIALDSKKNWMLLDINNFNAPITAKLYLTLLKIEAPYRMAENELQLSKQRKILRYSVNKNYHK